MKAKSFLKGFGSALLGTCIAGGIASVFLGPVGVLYTAVVGCGIGTFVATSKAGNEKKDNPKTARTHQMSTGYGGLALMGTVIFGTLQLIPSAEQRAAELQRINTKTQKITEEFKKVAPKECANTTIITPTMSNTFTVASDSKECTDIAWKVIQQNTVLNR